MLERLIPGLTVTWLGCWGRTIHENLASREDKVRVDQFGIPVGSRLLVPTGVLVRQVSLLNGKDRRLLRMVFFQFEARYKK